ncbi:MAG: (4Fe-4S)-binding protein [Ignavibacteria bacterium]|nr:(4Fe-4S)-binding protein [Ignavibacteria bacterium]
MYKNVGTRDRIFRFIIAFSLLGIIFTQSLNSSIELILFFLSFYLLYTSLTCQCFFYLIIPITTRKKKKSIKVKECSNDIITVYWSEKKCLNSTMCANDKVLKEIGYHNVFKFFNPKNRPWIRSYRNTNTDEIIRAVENCTSGALTYTVNADIKAYIDILERDKVAA